MLYTDSPIDASLLSLYVHQNYTQYCGDLAECAALADTLSWIDANGAESVRTLPLHVRGAEADCPWAVAPGSPAQVPHARAGDAALAAVTCAAPGAEAIQANIL